MAERVFTDKLSRPSEHAIKEALGDVYSLYTEINTVSAAFSKDWTYSKSSGWMLKVYDKKKSLFYLIPLNNEFKISMAIRENERDLFMQDEELKELHGLFSSAKKFVEGYAIQFTVSNTNEFGIVKLFIQKLIKIRT